MDGYEANRHNINHPENYSLVNDRTKAHSEDEAEWVDWFMGREKAAAESKTA